MTQNPLPATVYRPDWVSPKEAAEHFNVPRWTVLDWIRQGRVEFIRAGYRTIRINMASIEKMRGGK